MRLLILDYVRLFAMALILVDHSFYILGWSGSFPVANILGTVGVAIFFYISGYLAMHTLKAPFNARKYVLDKLIRLYPLYIVAVLLAFMFMPWVAFAGSQIAYPLMIQIFVSTQSGFLWFVSAIFWAYMLFALFILDLKLFVPAFLVVMLFLVLAGNVYMTVNFFIFFIGVKSKGMLPLERLTVPENRTVERCSNSTYSMYLFHTAIWMGLVSFYPNAWAFYLVYLPFLIVASLYIQDLYDGAIRTLRARPRTRGTLSGDGTT